MYETDEHWTSHISHLTNEDKIPLKSKAIARGLSCGVMISDPDPMMIGHDHDTTETLRRHIYSVKLV